jgi:hypothetical protein
LTDRDNTISSSAVSMFFWWSLRLFLCVNHGS